MKPYYEDDAVTLYHGDCREITTWLEADVLVTDPPYGRAWRQGQIAGAGNGRRPSDASAAHGGIANDADTSARDAALALWGVTRAVVFGDLMLPPPPGTRLVLIYRKPTSAGVRGAIAGRRRDLEAIYLMGDRLAPQPLGGGHRQASRPGRHRLRGCGVNHPRPITHGTEAGYRDRRSS